MEFDVKPLLPWIGALVGWTGLAIGASRTFTGRARTLAVLVGATGGAILTCYVAGKIGSALPASGSDSPHARATDIMKGIVAIAAASCVFYEIHRAQQKRPIALRWKKLVGVSLAVAAIALYFSAFKFGYPRFYHRWDQYHYYMGAKYYPEIGYDGLYKCSAVAQSQVGQVVIEVDPGKPRAFDAAAEVKKPSKSIRSLGGDNLLIKVDELLAHPEVCTDRFSPERWKQYKDDVTFFASQSYFDDYWTQMQRDHGYNPPPVWTLAGSWLANLHGPGEIYRFSDGLPIYYTQVIAMVDVLYLIAMFAALWWAFGWRIFAVAAILWGCQAPAPAYWTLGAMLRQDWLFYFVFAICLARKRWHALSGAAMVYSALLRIFPGVAVLGWLGVAFWSLVRKHTLTRAQFRTLIGGTLAAVVLFAASVKAGDDGQPHEGGRLRAATHAAVESYLAFYKHTIKVHDQTPLTNHMGLRVLVGHDLGEGPESGRMRYTKDIKLTDPFEVWKDMRLERYRVYKPVAYASMAMTFIAFMIVLRRVKSLWVAQCLGQVWIILLAQLTCYYYTFLVACAPLTRLRRDLEIWIFGFAAVSQVGWRALPNNDDKYTALTLLSLALCYGVLFAFAARPASQRAPQVTKSSAPSFLDRLDGITLAALVAIVPGVVMAVMGAGFDPLRMTRIPRDQSTILIGLGAVAIGVFVKLGLKQAETPAPAAPAPSPGTAGDTT